MTNITPYGKYLPYHSVYTNIQPFTYRDSRTFIERLEAMWEYISTIAPAVDEAIEKVVDLALTVHGDRTEMERILALFQNEYADFLATLDTATDVLEQAIKFRDEVENWLSSLIAVIPKVNNALAYTGELSDDKDVLADVQRAVNETPAGGTLFFPRGRYYTAPTTISITNDPDLSKWLVIDKPIQIVGEPGTVLENFHIFVKGTADAPRAIANATDPGGKVVYLSNHGFSVGDRVQLLSVFNVYRADAGEFQNGSINPTTGTQTNTRAADYGIVGKVTSNTVTLVNPVKFRYDANDSEITEKMPNVTSSEVRKIRPNTGTSITGIEFDNRNINSSKIISARYTENLSITDCSFTRDGVNGHAINIAESFNVAIKGCKFVHLDESTATASASNMLFIGGGCEQVEIIGNVFNGGLQCVDVTNLLLNLQVPEPSNSELRCDGISVKNVTISGNTARTYATALTLHPGTFDMTIADNIISHSRLGILSRCRGAIIKNNIVNTERAGISLSAFSHAVTVMGNVIRRVKGDVEFVGFKGINCTPVSSEIVSDNAWKNVLISDNNISSAYGTAIEIGGANVPTDVRNNVSDIVVKGNTVNKPIVVVNDTNGVTISGNSISSDTGTALISVPDRATHTRIFNNILDNTTIPGILFTETNYGNRNVIGKNLYLGGVANSIPSTRIQTSDIHGGDFDVVAGSKYLTDEAAEPPSSSILVEVPYGVKFLRTPVVIVDSINGITATVASANTESFFVRVTWEGTIRPSVRWIATGTRA